MTADGANPKYTSKIIKAGALLADTKTLLSNWDQTQTVAANLDRVRRENLLGKASRSRVEDVLAIFRQRYLTDGPAARGLVRLVKHRVPSEVLDPILYYYATQADALLHDTATEVLQPLRVAGRSEVSLEQIEGAVARWVAEGKTTTRWSDYVIRRVSRGLLATLRDFGALQGKANKKLSPMYLPVEAFSYIALCRKQKQPSGERLLGDPEWELFFLSREGVERFFIEAHQRRLLEYQAAGSVIRVAFPADSLEEYADVIAGRPY